MLRLHLRPDSAGMAPHAALAEAGAAFELVTVGRDDAQRPDGPFRRLSPNGTVPALEDEQGAVFEAAAICLHVAERFPAAALLPPAGTRERDQAVSWLAFFATTVQQEALRRSYPERYTTDPAGAHGVHEAAVNDLHGHYDLLAAQLADRAWLVGDTRSIADLYLFMLVHWSQNLDPPAWSRPALHAHALRCAALPGVARMLDEHGLEAPPP
jgi:glutathione S-transferase